jgi:ribosomal protein S27E
LFIILNEGRSLICIYEKNVGGKITSLAWPTRKKMNPIFISMVMARILGLKRDCPKCKRPQIVSSDMKHKTVKCKFCGADIPPKKLSS